MSISASIESFRAGDGYVFRYRRYPPLGKKRGLVVYLHGIQSHGGWYAGSSRCLAEAGWEVLFLDRRGSGLNEEARGDSPRYRRLFLDLVEFIQSRGEKPFVVAVSWGGKLAVGLEYFHPGLISGMALLTPGLCPQVRPALSQRLKIILARLFTPKQYFLIPLDDAELFTANPVRQAYIRADSRSLRRATARFLVSSVILDRALRKAPESISVPSLLMLAGHDRIIDNDKTKAYFNRFACENRRIIEYPKAHHTLEFEADPAEIVADLVTWLNQQ